MRVAVTGGRTYRLTDEDRALLDTLFREGRLSSLVHGGAHGLDLDAFAWAVTRDIPTMSFPAAWGEHGKAAGPMRNAKIVANADILVAFPGGRGTANCVEQATRAGLPIVYPHGVPAEPGRSVVGSEPPP